MLDKDIKKYITAWEKAFYGKGNPRTAPFGRKVSDALRKAGTTSHEIQSYITESLSVPESARTKGQVALLKTWAAIHYDSEHIIMENIAESPSGGQFLLKSTHGHEDKRTIEVGDSFADVIAANSQHQSNQ